MSFSAEMSKVKAPPYWVTVGIIALAVLLSWCAIHFDQARGAAYCTMPVLAFLLWCGEANISLRETLKIRLCVWVICLTYWFASNALLTQVISVESGHPIIKSGPIYELSVLLAG